MTRILLALLKYAIRDRRQQTKLLKEQTSLMREQNALITQLRILLMTQLQGSGLVTLENDDSEEPSWGVVDEEEDAEREAKEKR